MLKDELEFDDVEFEFEEMVVEDNSEDEVIEIEDIVFEIVVDW